MPALSDPVQRRLSSYTQTREGHQVPNTITGNIYDYACWNWVLSGGTLRDSDLTSISSIITNVFNTNSMGFPVGIKNTAAQVYPGNDAEFVRMGELLPTATDGGPNFNQDNAAQVEFLTCLVRVMLRANGLQPIQFSATNQCNIIVRSSNWWNTDHWALKIYCGPNAQQFVQTVPECPLMFSCSRVWDEHLPLVEVSISGLHQNQVDQLSTVTFSTCRGWVTKRGRAAQLVSYMCEAVLAAGAGQCSVCGFVACPTHLGSYDQAGVYRWGVKDSSSDTYKCQKCNGNMLILT